MKGEPTIHYFLPNSRDIFIHEIGGIYGCLMNIWMYDVFCMNIAPNAQESPNSNLF